ncbi:hypothetical protein [Nostoc sp. JL33]|uniref:hypothetical protein n=1 Tax=Nostoc sp. JL33 TaxID=2815396 RepID=UPI0025ECC4FB|nr:hypothetical protein [Nostoc sp. JL33]MBN3872384.1 hypothetical protein [Nostoc sp. JL33]
MEWQTNATSFEFKVEAKIIVVEPVGTAIALEGHHLPLNTVQQLPKLFGTVF